MKIQTEIISDLWIAGRLVIAAVLGGIVGYEREHIGKEAGVRTYAAICLGSCSFSLLALHVEALGTDPSRIVANIVTGIGFLGAGIIFHSNEQTKGLTTAASVWAMASVGVSVAFGHFTIAIITTIIIYVLLASKKLIQFFKNFKGKSNDSGS